MTTIADQIRIKLDNEYEPFADLYLSDLKDGGRINIDYIMSLYPVVKVSYLGGGIDPIRDYTFSDESILRVKNPRQINSMISYEKVK